MMHKPAGYVYLLDVRDTGVCKLGSTQHLRNRVRANATDYGFVRLIWYFVSNHATRAERHLQEEWVRWRIPGTELFRLPESEVIRFRRVGAVNWRGVRPTLTRDDYPCDTPGPPKAIGCSRSYPVFVGGTVRSVTALPRRSPAGVIQQLAAALGVTTDTFRDKG